MTVQLINENVSCPFCNMVGHVGTSCPKVKSIEYFNDGSVRKVEFHDYRPQPYWQYLPSDGTTPPAYPNWTVTCANTR